MGANRPHERARNEADPRCVAQTPSPKLPLQNRVSGTARQCRSAAGLEGDRLQRCPSPQCQ
eukprot:3775481-Pyramimonas_sp.AAC.1